MNTNEQQSISLGDWMALLAGTYPFFILGPVMVLLSYPFPPPEWRVNPAFQIGFFAVVGLPILAGFYIGWMKRFPLWTYPYLCLVSFFEIIAGLTLATRSFAWRIYGPLLLEFFCSFALVAFLVYKTRKNLPLFHLFEDIRQDWTRLSLGLLIVPTFFFSSIDHDEDPVLTPFVIGPSLVLMLTALFGLIATEKQSRVLILAGGMLLALLLRMLSGQFFYVFYWFISSAVVFAPVLLTLIPHRKTPQTAS
jgi:hypothetical protein